MYSTLKAHTNADNNKTKQSCRRNKHQYIIKQKNVKTKKIQVRKFN